MARRLTNSSSKLSEGKNDIQVMTGRSTNWNVYNYKLDSGFKPSKSKGSNSDSPFGNQESANTKKNSWWKSFFLKIKRDRNK